ncbi:glycosyltransferase [uncultured Helicobacter sp.]|uniref:glycosyltransferase n=2 Tax=uncultured Helicobacter sp. TaxID=175537 RepID=UPI003750C3BD
MNPFFYIIVPIYNVQAYLHQCLDSLINQTYTHFKAILINDGSTDLSGQIAQEYCDKDSRFVLITQQNAGLSMARNAGLAYIKNDLLSIRGGDNRYIVFVDSDDYIELDGLQCLATIISSNPSLDTIICNRAYHDTTLRDAIFFPTNDENKIFNYADILQQYPHICVYSVWLFVYQCDFLFHTTHMFEPYIYHEDNLFISYLLTLTQRAYIADTPIYHYRVSRQGSIMNTKTKVRFCDGVYSYFILTKRFYELSHDAQHEIQRNYLWYWASFFLKETLRGLQKYGYTKELRFNKSDLKTFYPFMDKKYRFCYHFPRIYGFPKKLRLWFMRYFSAKQ